jgi:hypothetical protein
MERHTDNEFIRYLDFAESQHLQALTTLCQNTDDMNVYTWLLAHKEEVAEAIYRRRQSIQTLDSSNSGLYEMDPDTGTFSQTEPGANQTLR